MGEKVKGVTVVENSFPASVYRSRDAGTFPFHHGLVTRQRFACMTLDFYALERTESNVTLQMGNADLDLISGKVAAVGLLRRMCETLGVEPVLSTFAVHSNGKERDDMSLMILDFTPVFNGFAPDEIERFPESGRSSVMTSPAATTTFAFLFNQSGKLVDCYEGIRDFFIDRDLTLSDLFFRRNEATSSFTSSRMVEQPRGQGILDAPKLGHIGLESLERDESLEVGFSVSSSWLPRTMSMIQLIVVQGDLEVLHAQCNFIG